VTPRVLVAGIGNVFFRDDGFGVAVAQALAASGPPEGAAVRDFGIRGLHLAYELLSAPALLVVADLLPHGAAPGTVCLFEPDTNAAPAAADNGHGMDLPAVFAAVRRLGGQVPRTLIVGCEPADVGEGLGLTPAVERAVPAAVALARDVVERALAQEVDP
jgi:hydrogenase maturation protease